MKLKISGMCQIISSYYIRNDDQIISFFNETLVKLTQYEIYVQLLKI